MDGLNELNKLNEMNEMNGEGRQTYSNQGEDKNEMIQRVS